MVRRISLIAGISLVCALAATAQDTSEQRIKKALEGRMVLVKMDLPAVDSGIDLTLDNTEVSYNTKDCDKLVKQYGVAIKNGANAKITNVRITRRGIELDLNGGGLPETDWVYKSLRLEEPAAVPKSNREIDLERQLQNEAGGGLSSSLRTEIDYERQHRIAQDEKNRDAFLKVQRLRNEYITENRKNWGSKVIVVVRSTKPTITMRDMVKALAKYVELLPSEKPAT